MEEDVGRAKEQENPNMSYYDVLVKDGRWPEITKIGENQNEIDESEYEMEP